MDREGYATGKADTFEPANGTTQATPSWGAQTTVIIAIRSCRLFVSGSLGRKRIARSSTTEPASAMVRWKNNEGRRWPTDAASRAVVIRAPMVLQALLAAAAKNATLT